MPIKIYIYPFLFAVALLASITSFAQLDIEGSDKENTGDTNIYYNNLNQQLILRAFLLHKANNVDIGNDNNSLRYRPNGTMSIGLGFNYKWLGMGLSIGLPSSKENNYKFGKTQRLDVQFSLFTKAIGLDAHLQNYTGYYLANPDILTSWDKDYKPHMPDMSVSTIGLNLFYIFNSKKFSYRAAFVGNQVQKKKAGSIVSGLFFNMDDVATDSGFIPREINDTSWTDYNLKEFKASTFGVTVGYLYTFVIGKKGWFISLAGVPGIGYRRYALTNTSGNTDFKEVAALHFLGRIAIGYTRHNMFFNLATAFNFRSYDYKSYNLSISTEKIRFTFGWRFETKASKRAGQHYHWRGQ